MNNPDKNILLFDGVCNLCNGLVRFIIKSDKKGKFRFASLQSESGQLQLKRLGLSVQEFESFVLIQGDKYYLKSTAALKMFRELGGIWKILYIFIWLPRPIRDFFYNIIAKYRYRIFGKRNACILPTPELEKLFL